MKKSLTIEKCWDCKHKASTGRESSCKLAGRKFGTFFPDTIPVWCPLPDASQQVVEADLEKLGFCLKCGTRPCTCKEKYGEEKAG